MWQSGEGKADSRSAQPGAPAPTRADEVFGRGNAEFSITMEIYTKVSDKATRDALKKLGESLDGS
jgi:hypothetical protein